MVCGSPCVLIQLTLVPTGTVRILGLNSSPGTLTQASLAPCTVGGVAGATGAAGVVGVVGVVGGAGVVGVAGDAGAVGVAGVAGVAGGAGLAQATSISNTPISTMAMFRIIRILAPHL